LLLFAAREAVQESLAFSPFELVFEHTVRGPLRLVKEKWLDEDTDLNLLDYVTKFKDKLYYACKVAQDNLKHVQHRMKVWYDKNAKVRIFQPGDKVLVFLPVPGQPLKAKYCGPYEIDTKINNLNYIVKTPGRRKQNRVCHVNMLTPYLERKNECESKIAATLANVEGSQKAHDKPDVDQSFSFATLKQPVKLNNSDISANLDSKMAHLTFDQREKLKNLVFSF
jgi:hypothetical protein